MFKSRLRLPSPALVIAIVALVLALGGTAIAAGISTPLTKASGTKLIKKLAPTLSVKHATAADTVGGQTVKRVLWKAAPGTTTQTILSRYGLTISGSCDGGSNITVDALGSSAKNAELRIQGNVDGSPFFKNAAGFDNTGPISLVQADGVRSEGAGQLVYATNDGHVLTFDYGFDWGTPGDGTFDNNWVGCTVYGQVIYS